LTAVKLVELRDAGGNIPQFSKDFKQKGTPQPTPAEHSKSSIHISSEQKTNNCTHLLPKSKIFLSLF
jgi:hypothetical protein